MDDRVPAALDHEALTVTLKDLARYFEVSGVAVMKYAREQGMPRARGKGMYPLMECIQWRYRKLQAKRGEDAGDVAEEREKLIRAQRIGHELANAKARGELLDAELVSTVLQHMAALISTQIDGLAARVAPQLAQIRDPATIAKVIFDECRAIRRTASRAVEDFAGELAGGEDPEPAPEAKRGRVGRRPSNSTPGLAGAGAVAD